MTDAFDRAVKDLLKTDWSDLGVLENQGFLFFPDTIDRRRKDGGVETVPVTLRVPVENRHRVQARVRARAKALELDLDIDRDEDMVSQLENYEILAFCVRDAAPPHDQHRANAEELWKEYPQASMGKLWTRLNMLNDTVDSRFGDLTAEECWKLAVRIAAQGEASPLADIAGFAQGSCITFLAREALKSPTAPSWVRSRTTSAKESSVTASKSRARSSSSKSSA